MSLRGKVDQKINSHHIQTRTQKIYLLLSDNTMCHIIQMSLNTPNESKKQYTFPIHVWQHFIIFCSLFVQNIIARSNFSMRINFTHVSVCFFWLNVKPFCIVALASLIIWLLFDTTMALQFANKNVRKIFQNMFIKRLNMRGVDAGSYGVDDKWI